MTKPQTNDPFIYVDNCTKRLEKDYEKHKSIVVACDFDNTIFDFHERGFEFPQVVEVLQKCNALGFKVVIFSASPKERYSQIESHCAALGIKIDGINCDVVEWRGTNNLDFTDSKIFFNILLDDRAGLGHALFTLNSLVTKIEHKKSC